MKLRYNTIDSNKRLSTEKAPEQKLNPYGLLLDGLLLIIAICALFLTESTVAFVAVVLNTLPFFMLWLWSAVRLNLKVYLPLEIALVASGAFCSAVSVLTHVL